MDDFKWISVAEFMDGHDLARAASTCFSFQKIFDSNILWEAVCVSKGLTSLPGTRTRGLKSWKSYYAMMLCVECKIVGGGAVVVDVDGGSSVRRTQMERGKITLCKLCFNSIENLPLTKRFSSQVLPRAKKRHPSIGWNAVMMKIPFADSGNGKDKFSKGKIKRKRHENSCVDGAHANDYKLKLIR